MIRKELFDNAKVVDAFADIDEDKKKKIKALAKMALALDWFKEELKGGKCSDDLQCNAYEAAIKALEKQIPKKYMTKTKVKKINVHKLSKILMDIKSRLVIFTYKFK